MYLVLPGLGLLLMVFALVDIIRADRWSIRHLDKSLWIIIVILLPLIGSVLWFAIGRDYDRSIDLGSFGDPRRRDVLPPVESTTERELAALDREIERQEQDDRIRRLEAELRARRGETTSEASES
jgi:hypothetical protein